MNTEERGTMAVECEVRRSKAPEVTSEHAGALNVVYVFNNGYAPIGGVSITSLFENNKAARELTVYILSDGFNEENKRKFDTLAAEYNRKIEIINIEEELKKYEAIGLVPYRGSYFSYLKMFFPDFFPDDIGKLIYIDADTVVLGDIAPLLNTTELLGMIEGTLVGRSGNAVGYTASFSTKLIVCDTARWKKEKWSQRIIDFVKNSEKRYLLADEGIMNMVCGKEIERLPLRFALDSIYCAIPKEDYIAVTPDLFYSSEEIASAYDAPVIIHMDVFLGEKPWQTGTIHPVKEYFDTWLAKSMWSGYKGDPVNTGMLYSLEKWLYKVLPKRMFYRVWILSQRFFAKREMRALND